MPRVLYIGSDARSLRDHALPLARPLSARGWQVEALAPGALSCPECVSGFRAVRQIEWGLDPIDPRRLLQAPSELRDLVIRQEYDLVHTVSPASGFLARLALHHLRSLTFPRLIHTSPRPEITPADRLAARWTDFLLVTSRDAYSLALRTGIVPAHRLHLLLGPDNPLGRDLSLSHIESIYSRCLDLPHASARSIDAARPHFEEASRHRVTRSLVPS